MGDESNLYSNRANPDIGIPSQLFSNGETYDVIAESPDPDPTQDITRPDSDNVAADVVTRRAPEPGTLELTIQRVDRNQVLPVIGNTFSRDANRDGTDEDYYIKKVTPNVAIDAFNTYTIEAMRVDLLATD